MSKPQRWFARELAAKLEQYGDMLVTVELVSPDNQTQESTTLINVEMNVPGIGIPWLSITGYVEDSE